MNFIRNGSHIYMRVVFVFFLLVISHYFFSSGTWGSYEYTGKAYKGNQPVCNDTLFIQYSWVDTFTVTDNKGNYRFLVRWSTFHPPGVAGKEVAKYNSKKIKISFKGKNKTVCNSWRKAQKTAWEQKVMITRHEMISYSKEEQPCMFCEVSSFDAPETRIEKNLRF